MSASERVADVVGGDAREPRRKLADWGLAKVEGAARQRCSLVGCGFSGAVAVPPSGRQVCEACRRLHYPLVSDGTESDAGWLRSLVQTAIHDEDYLDAQMYREILGMGAAQRAVRSAGIGAPPRQDFPPLPRIGEVALSAEGSCAPSAPDVVPSPHVHSGHGLGRDGSVLPLPKPSARPVSVIHDSVVVDREEAKTEAGRHLLALCRARGKGPSEDEVLTMVANELRVRLDNARRSMSGRKPEEIAKHLEDEVQATLAKYYGGGLLASVGAQTSARERALLDLAEQAWGIIANAGKGVGDWSAESDAWKLAAERFRDEYHAALRGSSERRGNFGGTCVKCGSEYAQGGSMCALCHAEVLETQPLHERCPFPGCSAPTSAALHAMLRAAKKDVAETAGALERMAAMEFCTWREAVRLSPLGMASRVHRRTPFATTTSLWAVGPSPEKGCSPCIAVRESASGPGSTVGVLPVELSVLDDFEDWTPVRDSSAPALALLKSWVER